MSINNVVSLGNREIKYDMQSLWKKSSYAIENSC